MRILAFAEISLQHLAEIEDKLNPKRAVKAKFVADLSDLLRCRIVTGEGRRRIGRHHPHHQKGHDQKPEKRRDGIRGSAQYKAQQVGSPPLPETHSPHAARCIHRTSPPDPTGQWRKFWTRLARPTTSIWL